MLLRWFIVWMGLGGCLLAGTASGQSIRFEHLSVQDGLPHNTVFAITQDQRGFMWFGTADGLSRYDDAGWQRRHSVGLVWPSCRDCWNATTRMRFWPT